MKAQKDIDDSCQVWNAAYFVHIPKTAGNSVRACLRDMNLLTNPGFEKSEREHHFGIAKAARVVNSHLSFTTPTFPCYLAAEAYREADFSFTVVRNPFDLLVSYYSHYVENPKKNWTDRGWANVNGHHGFNSFDSFVEFYCKKDHEEWHVPSLSQDLFGQIFDDEKNVRVDYAVYLENAAAGLEDLIELLSGSRVRVALPKKNVSSKRRNKRYQEFYTPYLQSLVEAKCEPILSAFGYEFDKTPDASLVKIKELMK